MKKLTIMLGVLFLLSACDKQINISITDKSEQNQPQNQIVQEQNHITLNDSSNNAISIQSSGKMTSIPLSNNTSYQINISLNVDQQCVSSNQPHLDIDENIAKYLDKEALKNGNIQLVPGVYNFQLSGEAVVIKLFTPPLTNIVSGSLSEINLHCIDNNKFMLDSQGSGNITLNSISSKNINITKAGLGELEVSGAVDNLTIDSTGSGNIKIGNVNSLNLRTSGLGEINANSVNNLSINTSGSGNIEIANVKNIQKLIKTGIGEVTLGGKNISEN